MKAKYDGAIGRAVENLILNNLQPPFRVGRAQGRAVLDKNGLEVVIFSKGKEEFAQAFCDHLNEELLSPAPIPERVPPTEREVTGCGDCPFVVDFKTHNGIVDFCTLNKPSKIIRSATDDGPIFTPSWCPLKTGPVMIKLTSPEGRKK